MSDEKMKYEKVLDLLKRSKPVLPDTGSVTEKIMRQIQEEKSRIRLPELIIEFLFGWVYIGWIRRSLIAAAIIVVVLFGYQQALILKRLNDLSVQRIPGGELIQTGLTDDLTNKMLMYRLTGKKIPEGTLNVSEKDIDDMIRSLNKLQVKYKDLLYMMDNDPQLKKYVEERINKLRKNLN